MQTNFNFHLNGSARHNVQKVSSPHAVWPTVPIPRPRPEPVPYWPITDPIHFFEVNRHLYLHHYNTYHQIINNDVTVPSPLPPNVEPLSSLSIFLQETSTILDHVFYLSCGSSLSVLKRCASKTIVRHVYHEAHYYSAIQTRNRFSVVTRFVWTPLLQHAIKTALITSVSPNPVEMRHALVSYSTRYCPTIDSSTFVDTLDVCILAGAAAHARSNFALAHPTYNFPLSILRRLARLSLEYFIPKFLSNTLRHIAHRTVLALPQFICGPMFGPCVTTVMPFAPLSIIVNVWGTYRALCHLYSAVTDAQAYFDPIDSGDPDLYFVGQGPPPTDSSELPLPVICGTTPPRAPPLPLHLQRALDNRNGSRPVNTHVLDDEEGFFDYESDGRSSSLLSLGSDELKSDHMSDTSSDPIISTHPAPPPPSAVKTTQSRITIASPDEAEQAALATCIFELNKTCDDLGVKSMLISDGEACDVLSFSNFRDFMECLLSRPWLSLSAILDRHASVELQLADHVPRHTSFWHSHETIGNALRHLGPLQSIQVFVNRGGRKPHWREFSLLTPAIRFTFCQKIRVLLAGLPGGMPSYSKRPTDLTLGRRKPLRHKPYFLKRRRPKMLSDFVPNGSNQARPHVLEPLPELPVNNVPLAPAADVFLPELVRATTALVPVQKRLGNANLLIWYRDLNVPQQVAVPNCLLYQLGNSAVAIPKVVSTYNAVRPLAPNSGFTRNRRPDKADPGCYYCVGPAVAGLMPFAVANNAHNESVALRHRHLPVAPPHNFPTLHAMWKTVISHAIPALANLTDAQPDLSVSDWLLGQRTAKVRDYNAYVRQNGHNFDRSNQYYRKSFIKQELLVPRFGPCNDVRPRLIQGLESAVTSAMSPAIQRLTNMFTSKFLNLAQQPLADLKASDFPSYCLACGSDTLLLGAWYNAHRLAGYTFLENDFKEYDASQSCAALTASLEYFTDYHGLTKTEYMAWKTSVNTKGRSRYYSYWCQGTRKSGDPHTSFENSFLNFALTYYLLQHTQPKLLIIGDDNVIALPPGCPPPDLRRLTTQFADYGFVAKLAFSIDNRPSFCSARFLPCLLNGRDTAVLVPDARRILAKIGWSLEPRKPLTAQYVAASTLLSMRHLSPLPIFRSLFAHYFSFEHNFKQPLVPTPSHPHTYNQIFDPGQEVVFPPTAIALYAADMGLANPDSYDTNLTSCLQASAGLPCLLFVPQGETLCPAP